MDAQTLATEIVRKLVNEGYTAYFAGGWVRDYLMGHPSDDIDIATDAPPEQILDLFPRTILVGLAFGVIVVLVDGHQFEVATFRRDVEYVGGRRPTQIELAKPEEDASRRDFTINGMFYDPLEDVVHDFVNGRQDIKHGIIRTIGDPYERFVEDRLRMIRAVRFAARFGFVIEEDTQEAIRASADTLFPAVAMERIWNEFYKMSNYPRFESALLDMHRLGLLEVVFPTLAGLHLNDLKKRLDPISHYQARTPTVVYLMALFPDAVGQDGIDLCRYLRTSAAEGHLAEFLVHVRQCVNKEQKTGHFDKVAWVHLYAHPQVQCCVEAVAAHMPIDERKVFLQRQQQRAADLAIHIQRVVQKRPLVNAGMLQEHGIVPGKIMGMLLKEAEKIAIEQNIGEADKVLEILKESEFWPRSGHVKASD